MSLTPDVRSLVPNVLSNLLTMLLEVALLPPGCLVLLGVAGLLLWRRRPRLGRALVTASVGLLWLLSTPCVGTALLSSLQQYDPLDLEQLETDAGAIVVLGGDLDPNAPEYGAPTVGELTLERLRYAARLRRASSLPILCSGGNLGRSSRPLGELMREVLVDEFQVEVKWTEIESQTTAENARRSATLLLKLDIDSVILVTHAWHMARAKVAFERAGLKVTPGPTAFAPGPTFRRGDFQPSTGALENSTWALHETLGRVWYWLRSAGARPGA